MKMKRMNPIMCPHCGHRLHELERRMAELELELERLGYSSVYVASKSRPVFHKPDRHWAAYFLDSKRCIEFASHREAVEAGYKPCKNLLRLRVYPAFRKPAAIPSSESIRARSRPVRSGASGGVRR